MKEFYQKNELRFSIILIVIYVVAMCFAQNLTKTDAGYDTRVVCCVGFLYAILLYLWIKKNNLSKYIGLCKLDTINLKGFLYFLPLLIICSTNLWFGVTMNYSNIQTIFYVINMCFVGFIEEVIFRGFLFNALKKDNAKTAFIISSITFGLGHIVNLLNGAELLSTILQMCYAVAIGFLFTAIYYKGKSLIPVIIAHAVINLLSAFAVDRSSTASIIVASIMIVVSVLYGLYILKRKCEIIS